MGFYGELPCPKVHLLPVECEIDMPFYQHPRVVKITSLSYDKNGDPGWYDVLESEQVSKDTAYRSVFGPLFSHSAVFYANSDNNINRALTRLTNCRGASLQYENTMLSNQVKYHRRSIHLRKFVRQFRAKSMEYFNAHPVEEYQSLVDFVNAPHPKRAEREAAFDFLHERGLVVSRQTEKVLGKLKKYEFAKPGKKPRLTVDLRPHRAVAYGPVAAFVKHVFAGFNDDIEFCASPSLESLRSVFTKLLHSDRNYLVYFSDDASGVVHTTEGPLRFNMDISNCDGSHSAAHFSTLRRLLPREHPFYRAFQYAIDQLSSQLVVKSKDKRRRNVYKFRSPTLFSGSTLTTLVNNLANRIMGLEITRADFSAMSKATALTTIRTICSTIGYDVTLDHCTRVEQLQFLKHSPDVFGNPFLNLGVVLRSLGQCVGDVPVPKKFGTLDHRMDVFSGAVVCGMKTMGRSCILEALESKFPIGGALILPESYLLANVGSVNEGYVSTTTLAARYGAEPSDFDELCFIIRSTPNRSIIRHRLVDKIFALDYGYAAPSSTFFETLTQ